MCGISHMKHLNLNHNLKIQMDLEMYFEIKNNNQTFDVRKLKKISDYKEFFS